MEDKKKTAQKRADKKWIENNKEHRRYLSYRTSARTFIRHWATKEDVDELLKIFNEENKNSKTY